MFDMEHSLAAASFPLPDLEPDPGYLLASEREDQPRARHNALVVLVNDAEDKETGALVAELLTEAEFTVGGTGVGPRDKTPEATRAVLDQLVPGIAQALRSSGLGCGAVDAATSRGIAGVSGSTVIVNLAGSRPAIRDGMATLAPLVHHVIDELP